MDDSLIPNDPDEAASVLEGDVVPPVSISWTIAGEEEVREAYNPLADSGMDVVGDMVSSSL